MTLVNFSARWGVDLDGIVGMIPGNILNDASGEGWAFGFQAPKTGNITAFVFRAGTVTSFQDMTISAETIGTDGLPSGSNYGGSTPGTWTGGTSNTSPEVTLGTAAAVTRNDRLCLRGEWAGTAGSLNIQYGAGGSATGRRYPKVYADVGSGFGLTLVGVPMLCVKYDDGTYHVPKFCWPPLIIGGVSITNSGTSPQETGVWLTPAAEISVCGGTFDGRTFGTTQTNTFGLYSTPAGTPALQRSHTVNHNQQSLVAHLGSYGFDPYTLSKDTDYVAAFLQSSTSSLYLYYVEVANVNHWGGWADGDRFCFAYRNSGGGAFTKVTTQKPTGYMTIDQIHDGGGGGGGPLIGGRLVG